MFCKHKPMKNIFARLIEKQYMHKQIKKNSIKLNSYEVKKSYESLSGQDDDFLYLTTYLYCDYQHLLYHLLDTLDFQHPHVFSEKHKSNVIPKGNR